MAWGWKSLPPLPGSGKPGAGRPGKQGAGAAVRRREGARIRVPGTGKGTPPVVTHGLPLKPPPGGCKPSFTAAAGNALKSPYTHQAPPGLGPRHLCFRQTLQMFCCTDLRTITLIQPPCPTKRIQLLMVHCQWGEFGNPQVAHRLSTPWPTSLGPMNPAPNSLCPLVTFQSLSHLKEYWLYQRL